MVRTAATISSAGPDRVVELIKNHYDITGGFGTLLMVCGKDYGTRRQPRSIDAALHARGGAPGWGSWTRIAREGRGRTLIRAPVRILIRRPRRSYCS